MMQLLIKIVWSFQMLGIWNNQCPLNLFCHMPISLLPWEVFDCASKLVFLNNLVSTISDDRAKRLRFLTSSKHKLPLNPFHLWLIQEVAKRIPWNHYLWGLLGIFWGSFIILTGTRDFNCFSASLRYMAESSLTCLMIGSKCFCIFQHLSVVAFQG